MSQLMSSDRVDRLGLLLAQWTRVQQVMGDALGTLPLEILRLVLLTTVDGRRGQRTPVVALRHCLILPTLN